MNPTTNSNHHSQLCKMYLQRKKVNSAGQKKAGRSGRPETTVKSPGIQGRKHQVQNQKLIDKF